MDIQVGLTKAELEMLIILLQAPGRDSEVGRKMGDLGLKLQDRLDVLNERILVARGNV